MARTTPFAAVAAAALLLTGCAASPPAQPRAPESSHVMPDGTVMSGAEHGAHGTDAVASESAPSHAAEMVCGGQVEAAIASLLQPAGDVEPVATWEPPMYTCTYDVDGAPLVLTVHDTDDVADGEVHFAEVQRDLGASDIEGMLDLGLPSFSTGDGVVGFLRDGKTLTVDATALVDSAMTPDRAAYATASAVLVCWVEHD